MSAKTIKDILLETTAAFQAAELETPVLDARLVVQHVMQMTHEEILMQNKDLVTDHQVLSLKDAAARRLQREPVSRIIGKRGFWKSYFKVSPETLDPRQDSESVIEAALQHVVRGKTGRLDVLDLGTGTGCLLLSLLQEWPKARGIGIDISAGAVDVARENAAALGLHNKAQFETGDWNDYAPKILFDVIVSNPPYIAEDEMADLAPEVTLYDPEAALVGGADGLDAYRTLSGLAPNLLKKGGFCFFEIGHTQGPAVKELLAEAGLDVLGIRRDLAGNDRVVVAKKH